MTYSSRFNPLPSHSTPDLFDAFPSTMPPLPAFEPRVIRSPMVGQSQVLWMNPAVFADNKARIAVPHDASDKLFAAAEEAIKLIDEREELSRKIDDVVRLLYPDGMPQWPMQ